MQGKLHILLLLMIITVKISAQIQDTIPDKTSDKISFLFIGDIMGHDEQILSAENTETGAYNYNEVFKYIRDEISEADIAVANLEVTLAGKPYTGYPQFSSPVELATACADAGIDFLVTANNHSADRYKKGILSTISRLDSIGMPHTGTFADQVQRDSLYPAVLKKNGFSVALLNYTYGTNGIKVQPPAIVNLIDKNLITRDIEKVKKISPDVIVLFMHWGTEYDTVPSADQQILAEYFLDNGVDLVIGSHPHVLQKMIRIKRDSTAGDRVTVYSLGNFVSNQRRLRTDGGSMVRIGLEKWGDSIIVTSSGYYLTWVYTPIEDNRKKFYILPCSKYETNPGFFSKPADYMKMMLFVKNSRRLFNNQNVNMKEIVYSGSDWIHD